MHLRKDRVFHRQIARIRDSSPCCHDNDYIYPKHRFLPYDLCGALHPILGESVFNIMHGNATLEQHYMEPIDQVWHTGRRGWCARGEALITIDRKKTERKKQKAQTFANTKQFLKAAGPCENIIPVASIRRFPGCAGTTFGFKVSFSVWQLGMDIQ